MVEMVARRGWRCCHNDFVHVFLQASVGKTPPKRRPRSQRGQKRLLVPHRVESYKNLNLNGPTEFESKCSQATAGCRRRKMTITREIITALASALNELDAIEVSWVKHAYLFVHGAFWSTPAIQADRCLFLASPRKARDVNHVDVDRGLSCRRAT